MLRRDRLVILFLSKLLLTLIILLAVSSSTKMYHKKVDKTDYAGGERAIVSQRPVQGVTSLSFGHRCSWFNLAIPASGGKASEDQGADHMGNLVCFGS